ncbi:MAG: A/G-specific adenine glycosylase [Actinomycetaceae bacterium]|nr:A/G-specific adenine glycosylase [Actinomycetaceae bacterium]
MATPKSTSTQRGSVHVSAEPRSVLPDDFPIERVVQTITDWFDRYSRDLPWRGPGVTAYEVMVCEVMSQQTPISRVIPKWRAWIEKWPTVAELADAHTSEVLSLWRGLGYPRRALHLQQAAQMIIESYEGVVPADPTVLITLPGIGKYTAGAVAAFAYGVRTPVIDTNVRRVLARLLGGTALPGSATRRIDHDRALALLPDESSEAARWSAAVMEFGSLICTSRNPACDQCPVYSHCVWRLKGSPKGAEGPRPQQRWEGTNRQLRGRVMALLCDSRDAGNTCVSKEAALKVALDRDGDSSRAESILNSLKKDGLIQVTEESVTLP